MFSPKNGKIQDFKVTFKHIKADFTFQGLFKKAMFCFACLILYIPVNNFYSYVGVDLPGLNQY